MYDTNGFCFYFQANNIAFYFKALNQIRNISFMILHNKLDGFSIFMNLSFDDF